MQQIQAKVTPIVVPVYELPEYISVETCCITRELAKEQSIEGNLKISRSLANMLENDKSDSENRNCSTQTAVPCKVASMDQGTMTTDGYTPAITKPSRGREVQTERPPTADVGIQCQRDLCDEWWQPEPPISVAHQRGESEDEFLSYVSQHTSMFPNGMLECCICGEVANSLKEHQHHIALHYGPPALCAYCGQLVEHQRLLAQHSYRCPARPNARTRPQMHIQCPHLHCSLMITSRRQLRRHLSTHLGVSVYYCLQCRKSFDSTTQFLVHRLMEAACSRAKHIHLAKNPAQSRAKSSIHRCSVCLRRFSTASRCVLHKRRCILEHHRRLQQQLTSA